MNTRKIIDYIQVLFWILVLVAGATGAYTYFSWGYLDWFVIGEAIIVFLNPFMWTIALRESHYFRDKTNPWILAYALVVPIALLLMNLNNAFTGWNTGFEITGYTAMKYCLIILIFILSLIKGRYGIISTLSLSTVVYLANKDFNQYLIIFCTGFILVAGILILKLISKKVIFRRWSDIFVKQEQKMEQQQWSESKNWMNLINRLSLWGGFFVA